MNVKNMNVKNEVFVGIAAAALSAITGIAGYQFGMRRTRAAYLDQINVLTQASVSKAAQEYTSATPVPVTPVAPVEETNKPVEAIVNGEIEKVDILPAINTVDDVQITTKAPKKRMSAAEKRKKDKLKTEEQKNPLGEPEEAI